ncbi:MAG: aldehyde dehydrogenase family protein, partial [Rhodoferax sp.]
SHDAIVWGVGEQARANKAAGKPQNTRTITSELGAVCPTIVVPGPWSDADIDFQAQQVASQKLHNSGFNCVACQVLVLAKDWPQKAAFVSRLEQIMAASEGRRLYYPGAKERLAGFAAHNPLAKTLPRAGAEPVTITPLDAASDRYSESVEVFAPALSLTELDPGDPEAFLRAAITYANQRLYGTLGANIVIHPRTIAQIGRARFEEMLIDLRYGTIAINTWTGLGFLTPQAAWGAFPGHTLADVQSGIGFVHNTLMFDKPQRNVVEAPFKTPKPPWFITHRKGAILGRLLTSFQYRPSWLKLPRIFLNALLG